MQRLPSDPRSLWRFIPRCGMRRPRPGGGRFGRSTWRRSVDEPTDSGPTNWGRWGPDDERGTANLLTPETVLAACAAATSGRVYNLGIELKPGAPFAGRRMSPVHLMSSDGGDYAALGRDDWGTADDYLFLALGGTTHVDALSPTSGRAARSTTASTSARCARPARRAAASRRPAGSSRARCSWTLTGGPDDAVGHGRRTSTPSSPSAASRRSPATRCSSAPAGWTRRSRAWRRPPVPGRRPRRPAGWFAEHDIAVVGADNPAVEATGRAACCRRCTAC